MRNQFHKTSLAGILLIALLLSLTFGASAQEIPQSPAETVAATDPISATEPEETSAPTELAEPIPEESEPVGYTINTNTEIYRICDQLAQNMEARHILVYDTNTNTILYTKTVANEKVFPASITKLFSTYVALQYLDPNTIVTAGDELDLVHAGSSVAYVGKGNQLRVEMLVEGMMLPSGNDAAMVLAAAAGRVIAQDETLGAQDAVDAFVDEMNRQAEALGFQKTHFSNPDGWHTGSHYTCLQDLARIAKLALENKTISRYMRLQEDDTYFVSGQHVIWENTNLLLDREGGYYRSDAIGMKTGYTRPAGYSVMTAFTYEEGAIVVGLFGYTGKYDRFRDAIRLAVATKDQLRQDAKLQEEIKTNPGVG